MDPKFSRELDYLFDHRPSVFRNSIYLWIVKVVCILLSIGGLVLGLGFVFTDFGNPFVEQFLKGPVDAEILKGQTRSLGIMLLILSIVFDLAAYLCSLVLKRNVFLIHLLSWHEDFKKSERENEFGEKWRNRESLLK